MCGIAGFMQGGGRLGREELLARVEPMCAALARRGPDDRGAWAEPAAGLALGHRRLSILDLSPQGAQPMLSHDGRWVLIYNGEIYNHLEIKRELEAQEPALAGAWRGHSDTEVLLEAVARWGLARALRAAAGMFALALWDRRQRRLSLARDRLGKKPLYYGWQNGVFLFGSELKALRAHPAFAGRIDRQALALYLRQGNVPAPWCIYQGLRKLPPGCWLSLAPGETAARPQPYWSALEAALAGQADPLPGGPAEAQAAVEQALGRAVAQRLISDVPLGALLSGGLDSSVVAALMAEASPRPVKTFTIGFGQASHDEAAWARAVADRLGSEHTELYLAPERALEIIPELPVIYDEPFADSSQMPTCLVAALARQEVTVALSGDGGDEVFGGYERYQWTPRLVALNRRLPRGLRRLGAAALASGDQRLWRGLLRAAGPLLPRRLRKHNPADNLSRLAEGLVLDDPLALYQRLLTLWPRPQDLVVGAEDPPAPDLDPAALQGLIPRLMYLDSVGYLPDDILTKVDRASMAVSLEVRCPLLDHRVFELAWRLPLEMKVAHGRGKRPLYDLLTKRLPAELVERPKMGFGVPLAAWLRGPLKDWAADLLEPARLRAQGYLRPEPIARAWAQHLSGRRDWHHHLWAVLMFVSWLAEQKNPPRPPALPPL
ncbi:MAG: asparagine synthase (glutamine-hydrolyzing) [Desulfarculus sp.]|nr:MAG: asparagine synthase (glutamine-hydrolyzing) [Desulfarculus sp.]